jgi:DNA-binding response OmpR family regulator
MMDQYPKGLILLVDDEEKNLTVTTQALKQHGYRCLTARDGHTGIQRAILAQPDLILLDVRMPGIDGFETCRRLKANDVTRDIPVLFMTIVADLSEKVRGFEVGGVDYLTKPIELPELFGRVTAHITIRRQQKLIEAHNNELQEALAKVKLLSGLLPICMHCKKVRDDEGYWQQVEVYIRDHSEAEFSHGVCPDCKQKYYAHYFNES